MTAVKSISNGLKQQQQLSARASTASSNCEDPLYARFYCPNKFDYMMRKTRVTVGRTSVKSKADVDMGYSSFISRNHLEVYMDDKKFYTLVTGKNGVFVDNVFHRKGGAPFELAKTCVLRFPSTDLRIQFQVMLDDATNPLTETTSTVTLQQPGKLRNGNATTAAAEQQQKQQSQQLLQLYREQQAKSQDSSGGQVYVEYSSAAGDVKPAATTSTHQQQQQRKTKLLDWGEEPPRKERRKEGLDEIDIGVPDWTGGNNDKPPFSYAQLIIQAISSQRDKQLTLNGIYNYISTKYPYYRASDKGWQNSIRHNLSLNRYFVKVARGHDESGKGSFWRIDPSAEPAIFDCAFKRKRKSAAAAAAAASFGTSSYAGNNARTAFSRNTSLEMGTSATIQQMIEPEGGITAGGIRYSTEDSLLSWPDSLPSEQQPTNNEPSITPCIQYVADPTATTCIQYVTEGNNCYTIVSLVDDSNAASSLATVNAESLQQFEGFIQSQGGVIDLGDGGQGLVDDGQMDVDRGGVGYEEGGVGDLIDSDHQIESVFSLSDSTNEAAVGHLIDSTAVAAGSASASQLLRIIPQQLAASSQQQSFLARLIPVGSLAANQMASSISTTNQMVTSFSKENYADDFKTSSQGFAVGGILNSSSTNEQADHIDVLTNESTDNNLEEVGAAESLEITLEGVGVQPGELLEVSVDEMGEGVDTGDQIGADDNLDKNYDANDDGINKDANENISSNVADNNSSSKTAAEVTTAAAATEATVAAAESAAVIEPLADEAEASSAAEMQVAVAAQAESTLNTTSENILLHDDNAKTVSSGDDEKSVTDINVNDNKDVG